MKPDDVLPDGDTADCVMTAPSAELEIFFLIVPVPASHTHTQFLVSLYTSPLYVLHDNIGTVHLNTIVHIYKVNVHLTTIVHNYKEIVHLSTIEDNYEGIVHHTTIVHNC